MKCPHCEATENIWGREVRGVYDGVLFWTCNICLRAWSRDWTGFGRRQEIADSYVQQWNDYADAADAAMEAAAAMGCPVCGLARLATADDVIAGRARYADTPGGHADRHTRVVEAAERVISTTN